MNCACLHRSRQVSGACLRSFRTLNARNELFFNSTTLVGGNCRDCSGAHGSSAIQGTRQRWPSQADQRPTAVLKRLDPVGHDDSHRPQVYGPGPAHRAVVDGEDLHAHANPAEHAHLTRRTRTQRLGQSAHLAHVRCPIRPTRGRDVVAPDVLRRSVSGAPERATVQRALSTLRRFFSTSAPTFSKNTFTNGSANCAAPVISISAW